LKVYYFIICSNCSFFNSTKHIKLLDKNEHNDVAETDLFKSEASSDSHEEPSL